MTRLLRTCVALLLLLAVACAPAAPPAVPAAPQAPGTGKRSATQVLKMGTNTFPAGVTPYASAYNSVWYGLMFDTLVWFDKDFNIQPAVAEKWEILPDNSAWRFSLRKDLTFSNGDKLNADDVVFTVETAIRERMPVGQQASLLTGAKKIDDYTVDFTLAQRDIGTLFTGPSWYIMPKTYYTSVGKDGFLAKPIGSGPMTLAEYVPNDLMVYKSRAAYSHPFKKPNLTEVRVKNVPDPSALLIGMRTGEVDMAIGSFSADQAKSAKDSGITVEIQKSGYSSIIFVQDTIKGTPLENKNVRLALNYAIDKDAIAKQIYNGFADPIGQLAAPGSPAFNSSLKPIPYDPKKAKELLTAAGYPNGFKIAGGMDYVARPVSTSQAQAVQSYHRDIGVEWELLPVESGVYVDIAYGLNNRTRHEMLDAGGSNQNGVFTFPWTFLKCDQKSPLFCSPGLDQNMKLALAEFDREKRNVHLQNGMKAWVEDYPMLFLVAPPQFTLLNPKVKEFQWTTQSYYLLDSVYMAE